MKATYFHKDLPPRAGTATKTDEGYTFVGDNGFTATELVAVTDPNQHHTIVLGGDTIEDQLARAEDEIKVGKQRIAELEAQLAELDKKKK